MRHTGSYSDYRCEPLFYTDDEDIAKSFVEKATNIAKDLEVKKQKIWENFDWRNDENDLFSELARKQDELKSPFDGGLEAGDFDEVNYDYTPLDKVSLPS